MRKEKKVILSLEVLTDVIDVRVIQTGHLYYYPTLTSLERGYKFKRSHLFF